nr:ImmA/IrrE family metallo-endopeptidase [Candidatus Wallbacteria bacterium]
HVDKHFYYRNKKSSEAIIKEEIDANKFAAELLIPSKFIHNYLKKYDENSLLDEDIITQLANKFKVSVTAMSFKIQNLGYSF